MSRALRGTIRLLARALAAPAKHAVAHLELFAEELLLEIRARDIAREDSFMRIIPLLQAA